MPLVPHVPFWTQFVTFGLSIAAVMRARRLHEIEEAGTDDDRIPGMTGERSRSTRRTRLWLAWGAIGLLLLSSSLYWLSVSKYGMTPAETTFWKLVDLA